MFVNLKGRRFSPYATVEEKLVFSEHICCEVRQEVVVASDLSMLYLIRPRNTV